MTKQAVGKTTTNKTFCINNEVLAKVRELAKKENRTESNMISTLLKNAIEAMEK